MVSPLVAVLRRKRNEVARPAFSFRTGLRILSCRSADAAGRRVGASAGQSRFKAHVTLARAKKPTDLRPYVSTLRTYQGPTWTADAVALVRSHLGAGENRRALYETLSTHQLFG